jgi:hypothetical protein
MSNAAITAPLAGGGSDVFHAQGAYLFQDTCVNLKSSDDIAGDWVSVKSGSAAGPGGNQLDKISRGTCGPLFVLTRALRSRSVHTQGGASASWDGKVLTE